MTRRWLIAASVGGVTLAVAGLMAVQLHAKASTPSSISVQMLAQGTVKSLPSGKVFISILEFRQVPGADFGPHAHVPGIVYTLHGVATISYFGAGTQSVRPGEAAFIPALAIHTHQNVDGRFGAAVIAVGFIAVVILLCAATWLRGRRRGVSVGALSLLLVAGGAIALNHATANDYYLMAARAPVERSRAMPRPDGRVVFLSPDMNPVPQAPYMETLRAITLPPGGRYDAQDVRGTETLIVVQGTAAVHSSGDIEELSGGQASFAQAGQALAIINPGSDILRVLDFAITPLSATR